jgi:hypothetical protein
MNLLTGMAVEKAAIPVLYPRIANRKGNIMKTVTTITLKEVISQGCRQ